MKKTIVDTNENTTDTINKESKEEVNTSSDKEKEESANNNGRKKILILNGTEYEFIRSVPGVGFKSKEEEEEFVKNLFNYDEYDIYNTPNMGVRA